MMATLQRPNSALAKHRSSKRKFAVLTSKSSPNRFGKRWIMTHDFTTKTWNGNPMKLSLSIVPNDQLDCIRLDRCVPWSSGNYPRVINLNTVEASFLGLGMSHIDPSEKQDRWCQNMSDGLADCAWNSCANSILKHWRCRITFFHSSSGQKFAKIISYQLLIQGAWQTCRGMTWELLSTQQCIADGNSQYFNAHIEPYR